MLEIKRNLRTLDETAANEPSAAELFTYALGVVRRQMLVVLLFAMLGAGLGAITFLRATPPYTASATLWSTHTKSRFCSSPRSRRDCL